MTTPQRSTSISQLSTVVFSKQHTDGSSLARRTASSSRSLEISSEVLATSNASCLYSRLPSASTTGEKLDLIWKAVSEIQHKQNQLIQFVVNNNDNVDGSDELDISLDVGTSDDMKKNK